jgi:hypothetical protein
MLEGKYLTFCIIAEIKDEDCPSRTDLQYSEPAKWYNAPRYR